MTTRYAIQFINPVGEVSYQMQGLPNVPVGSDGFEFAVLYASKDHALKASKVWKLRTAIETLKNRGWTVNILTVVVSKFETESI